MAKEAMAQVVKDMEPVHLVRAARVVRLVLMLVTVVPQLLVLVAYMEVAEVDHKVAATLVWVNQALLELFGDLVVTFLLMHP